MLANSRLPRRGGGPGSEQDVMTELDRGSLPAPTTTFGKRPWDYKGSDKAHLSYFTVGNIYAHSPGFPSRTWPSLLSQRKEDKLYDFQGHYAISGGDHVVSVNMFLVSSFPCSSLLVFLSFSPTPPPLLHLLLQTLQREYMVIVGTLGNTEEYNEANQIP